MKKFLVYLFAFTILNNFTFAMAEEEILMPDASQSKPVVEAKEAKVSISQIPVDEDSLGSKISLSQAIDLALARNLEIQKTRMNIDKAKNNIKIANKLQPSYIQFFGNSGKAATDNPDNFGLIQPIEIGKRGPRKRLAKSNLELTQKNVELAEFNLKMDVRQAYVDLVAAKSMVKILLEQQKLLQDLVDIAQKKYNVGVSPEMEVIQAKMALHQMTTQVNTAKTNVDVARYNFNQSLNIKDNVVLYDTQEDYLPVQKDFLSLMTPSPDLEMPGFGKIAEVATSKRLDMKIAKQSIDVAQKNLVVIMRQKIPDIEIGGGGLYVPNSLTTADSANAGYYIAGNITNIPLFYHYSPEIKNAKIEVEQSELNYNTVRNKAINDLHSTYDEFVTAQKNLNYYNNQLMSESERYLGLSKKSYEIGKTNITNFIFIEQSYKNILTGYTNALTAYYNSWVDFLREVNDEEIKLNE